MHVLGQIRRYHRALWGALLALLIASLLSMQLATAVSADVSVNIVNFTFDSTPLTIPVGTTVVWTNRDTAPHSATSDPNMHSTMVVTASGTGSTTGSATTSAPSVAPTVPAPSGPLKGFIRRLGDD